MVTIIAMAMPSLPESIGYGSIIHFLLCVVAILHILRKPNDARTSLLWIFITTSLPFFGVLAYVLFGINTIPEKGWEKQLSDSAFQNRQSSHATHPLTTMRTRQKSFRTQPPAPENVQLNRIMDQIARNHPLLGGNAITLLEPAEAALETMFQAIREARHSISLSTYIFGDDCVGKRLMGLLEERARAGVKVRLLYDAFGSAGPSLRLFFWRRRNVPNFRAVGYSQANILKRKFQINPRNHRKILVIDGKEAFTGGINFYDIYLKRRNEEATIDYHFRVRGPIVLELQYTFLRDWYYMTDDPFDELLSHDLFPAPEKAGETAVRLQNSGPTRDESETGLDTCIAAFNQARRQILIVTPYFVPPEPLILAFRQAAYRGVEVKVLVPSTNNNPMVKLASQALYETQLKSGIRIFERHPPFIHAKAMVIDDNTAIIGSANMDPRSLFLNYETNLVVFDTDFAATLKATMLQDLAQSNEVTYSEWCRRPMRRQLAENFFNLFHPVT